MFTQHATLFEFEFRQQRQRRIGRLAGLYAGTERRLVGEYDTVNALLLLDNSTRTIARLTGLERQVVEPDTKPEPPRRRCSCGRR